MFHFISVHVTLTQSVPLILNHIYHSRILLPMLRSLIAVNVVVDVIDVDVAPLFLEKCRQFSQICRPGIFGMNCALQLIPAVLDRIAVRRTSRPRQNVHVLLFYKYASILAHPVQGGVLAPILCIVYIDELINILVFWHRMSCWYNICRSLGLC